MDSENKYCIHGYYRKSEMPENPQDCGICDKPLPIYDDTYPQPGDVVQREKDIKIPEENEKLTLRDQFAMHAPQSLIDILMTSPHQTCKTYREILKLVCCLRYEYADAMLAAREKK